MRRLHLIDKHHYPKYFPFDLVYTGSLTFNDLRKRQQKRKDKKKSQTMDFEMEDLVKEMDQKLKIPKSISFGSKHKRFY